MIWCLPYRPLRQNERYFDVSRAWNEMCRRPERLAWVIRSTSRREAFCATAVNGGMWWIIRFIGPRHTHRSAMGDRV